MTVHRAAPPRRTLIRGFASITTGEAGDGGAGEDGTADQGEAAQTKGF